MADSKLDVIAKISSREKLSENAFSRKTRTPSHANEYDCAL